MNPNVRLVDNHHMVVGRWFVNPGDERKLSRIRKELADFIAEEPMSGWHLETRGDVSDWHDYQP